MSVWMALVALLALGACGSRSRAYEAGDATRSGTMPSACVCICGQPAPTCAPQ